MLRGRRRDPQHLQLFLQLGDGLILLLQALAGALAVRFLSGKILLQPLHFSLISGQPLPDL